MIRHLRLLPFYYFLPEDIVKAHNKRFQSIPRNPWDILEDSKVIEYIESMEFVFEIGDIVSAAVWYYMDMHSGSGVYSEYDPIWTLSYICDWYLTELTKQRFLYPVQALFNTYHQDIPYTPWLVYHIAFLRIVPRVIAEHNLQPIIDYVKKHRCFEDFQEGRNSKQKKAFHDRWYHSRTKHPDISLEDAFGEYDEDKNEYPHEPVDPAVQMEEDTVSQVQVDDFLDTLLEKDRKILELRMDDVTYEEIAELLGFKTHSAVIKRIKRIGKAYQQFAGIDLGFK